MTIAEKNVKIAENERKVFDSGRLAEYDAFWDAYQQNGNRRDYKNAFSNAIWTDATFNPKYNIVCSGNYFANSMFANATGITRIPVVMDFSEGIGEMYSTFQNTSSLRTIKKIIFGEKNTFYNTFYGATLLTDITVGGVIAADKLNFQHGTFLTKPSIVSIIRALSDNTNDFTLTLSKTAVNKAFETSTGANDGASSSEWGSLTDEKWNWNISLV